MIPAYRHMDISLLPPLRIPQLRGCLRGKRYCGTVGSSTCMMNRMMGFFGSYSDGFAPSRMPPCGGTWVLAAELDATVEVTVTVSLEASVELIVRMCSGRICAAEAADGSERRKRDESCCSEADRLAGVVRYLINAGQAFDTRRGPYAGPTTTWYCRDGRSNA